MDKQNENLVVVYTSEDQVEQSMIEGALKDAGIDFAVHPHEVLDYLQSTELNSGSQILVLEEDVERASAIVSEILSPGALETPPGEE